MPQTYAAAGIEPPLEELLNDPITHLLMRRDGIDVADVRRAITASRSDAEIGVQGVGPDPRASEVASSIGADLRTDGRAG